MVHYVKANSVASNSASSCLAVLLSYMIFIINNLTVVDFGLLVPLLHPVIVSVVIKAQFIQNCIVSRDKYQYIIDLTQEHCFAYFASSLPST